MCAAMPLSAHADNINVVFQHSPLFSDSNMAPGETVTRTVTVTNTSGATQDVYVKARNGVSKGGLGNALLLSVTDGAVTTVHDLPLSKLTGGSQELIGSGLADGATKTYDFSVYFDPAAGNDAQGSTLSFDLCVGFVGDSNQGCMSNSGTGQGSDSSIVSPAGPGLDAGSNGPISLIRPDNAELPPSNPSGSPDGQGTVEGALVPGDGAGASGNPSSLGRVLGASTQNLPSPGGSGVTDTEARDVLGQVLGASQVAAAAGTAAGLGAFLAAHPIIPAFLLALLIMFFVLLVRRRKREADR